MSFFFLIFSFMERTKLASFSYVTQLRPPLDMAIYWVKHVARHQGAPHLRSIAIDMPFYVYYNLDCFAVIVVFSILWLFISLKVGKRLFRCICNKFLAKKLKQQ